MATACVPMLPEAPALFSTTIGCPSRFDSASAITRPVVSVTPPGANGTTRRMGFSGYSAHALAAMSNAATQTASAFIVTGRNGGERGIRTLDARLSPHNALAGRPLRPLGHLSGEAKFYHGGAIHLRTMHSPSRAVLLVLLASCA